MFIFYTHASSSIARTMFTGHLIQFIGRFGIIMGVNWLYTYGTKMNGKDLKVSLGDERWLNMCFYGLREEKPYLPPNYTVQASKLLCQCYVNHTQYIHIYIYIWWI